MCIFLYLPEWHPQECAGPPFSILLGPENLPPTGERHWGKRQISPQKQEHRPLKTTPSLFSARTFHLSKRRTNRDKGSRSPCRKQLGLSPTSVDRKFSFALLTSAIEDDRSRFLFAYPTLCQGKGILVVRPDISYLDNHIAFLQACLIKDRLFLNICK